MTKPNRWRRIVADDRGTALVWAAVALVVLLGAAALAVDLGMLFGGRTQAQRTADAAAHGGAVHLAQNPGDSTGARSRALEVAAANLILGENIHVVDVTVDLTEETVKADVYRTADRGVPVATLFARILNFDDADVAATATAKVFPAGAVFCPLPVALPDRWWENPEHTRTAGPNDTYDPDPADPDPVDGEPDEYVALGAGDYAGYTADDFGTTLTLASGTGGGGDWNASWYYGWSPPDQPGGANYRDNIARCVDYDELFLLGDSTGNTEPGAKVGPVRQGFQDLLSSHDATWMTDEEPNYVLSDCGRNCSPLIRPLGFFDPNTLQQPGKKSIRFTNFIAFYVEGINPDNSVYGRLMTAVGANPVTDPAAPTSGTLRAVRLIK